MIEDPKTVIGRRVQTFRDNVEQYLQSSYKEAQLRKEFIDPFFIALGWDVDNEYGRAEKYKEVINEDAIRIGGSNKAPDYAFRVGGARIFFVEAKKPSVNILVDPEPAFQLKLYAWNTKIPISILTNFRHFAIYDCSMRPNAKDSASTGRLFLTDFESYIEKFEAISEIFSKDAVLRGSFDRYAESKKGGRGTTEVDSVFLKEIEQWRSSLAKNVASMNPDLSLPELNFAVQQTINRILFLRICEDKSIESPEWLKKISDKSAVYPKLLEYFHYADEKYNSGIFDFQTDRITERISVDDKVLKEIVSSLYYPYSSYDFSVLPVEILGSVYERFLGKTVKLTASHNAKVEDKPEVRQAGGIYYTPDYVVDYIVQHTVGRMLQNKSPEAVQKIRILDPACGSGTFLLRAYSYLLDYYLEYYTKNPKKYKKEIYLFRENRWLLTTDVRKKILLNNIFGVDIDPQAVEITKLSLLLKVLENETKESVNQQLKLFQERALPNLDNNIKCGNSVVDSSFLAQTSLDPIESSELSKVNPFDWEDKQNGFGDILKEGGFHVIIGNPPYVKEYTNRSIFDPVKRSKTAKYYQGKMDFWYLFTCKAIDLLAKEGLHGFIAQNNWITSYGASIMRNKILKETELILFTDFNDYKVFRDAGIQTMIFVAQKKSPSDSYMVDYSNVVDKAISQEELKEYLLTGTATSKIKHYNSQISPNDHIDKTIDFAPADYGGILTKLASKANFELTEKEVANAIHHHHDNVDKKRSAILGGRFNVGDGIFVLSNKEKERIPFTKRELDIIKPSYTTKELFRYYGNPKNKEWVIYTDSRFKDKKQIENYPNIKKHLDQFTKVITSDNKPYGLHRAREEHLFRGEKIIAVRKCAIPTFTYVDFDSYVSATFYVIKTGRINQKYLTGLLNSKLVSFWLKHKGKMQGINYQLDKEPIIGIPILNPSDLGKEASYKTEIITAVNAIIDSMRQMENLKLAGERLLIEKQIRALQNRIDENVYKLYGLSPTEIEAIELLFG